MHLYHISDNIYSESLTSKVQYNRADKETKIAKAHQEELLVEIANKIKHCKSKGIKDYIIAGNFNQDMTKVRIVRFVKENELEEIHQAYNNIDNIDRDVTHRSS